MRGVLGEPTGTCQDLVYSTYFVAISVVVSWLVEHRHESEVCEHEGRGHFEGEGRQVD